MTSVPILGTGLINFEFLKIRTGSTAGGRDLFEKMIQDVVDVKFPGSSTLEANPGDWGIDAYVGTLVEGEADVWQSKYFIDGFGDTQKAQVRDAYDQAKKCADREKYKLASWTLCIPVDFDGPTEKWWLTWKKKKEKDDGVTIVLWNAMRLRRLLQSEDAREVREYYFTTKVTVAPPTSRPTVTLDDFGKYDGALFVRQMHEAGMLECDEAKEEFFNAEILSHEISDKGMTEEIQALAEARQRLGSLWAQRFNTATQAGDDRRLIGLYVEVMDAIRDYHPNLPAEIRCGLVHAFGIMHQRVNDGRAGWVRDYRDVAADHSRSTQEPQVGLAAAEAPTGTVAETSEPTSSQPLEEGGV
ncbi:serine/threonine protein kinase [Streptomyces sp. XY431]|uniref:serine/threonine protein kinase n=1 Tax=Streptomyces sp. XY431 TaxID=1415562 RepID=UPI000AE8D842|nr:serine/threonine protein kinase [Streptomyces sp. XY431]